MNRRRFLQWLGGTAAGAAAAHVLDVEKLLWIPGEKTIFLPTDTVGLTTFITPLWVTKDAIAHFKNVLRLTDHFNNHFGYEDLSLAAFPLNMRLVTTDAETR